VFFILKIWCLAAMIARVSYMLASTRDCFQCADRDAPADAGLRLCHLQTTVVGVSMHWAATRRRQAVVSIPSACTFYTFINMGVLRHWAGLIFAARLNTATPKAAWF